MDNAAYTPFEEAFREAATPLLEQLKEALGQRGFGPFSKIEIIDRDIERGLGFQGISNSDHFVDLMLTDGDVHGFEGVSLMLACSVFGSGCVWAPENYTERVGMTTTTAVTERLHTHFDASEIADRVGQEWRAREADAAKHPSPRGT